MVHTHTHTHSLMLTTLHQNCNVHQEKERKIAIQLCNVFNILNTDITLSKWLLKKKSCRLTISVITILYCYIYHIWYNMCIVGETKKTMLCAGTPVSLLSSKEMSQGVYGHVIPVKCRQLRAASVKGMQHIWLFAPLPLDCSIWFDKLYLICEV